MSRNPSGASARVGMLSAEHHAELAARCGELIRGLQRLLDAPRPAA